ncbi:MAG: hypothetical protein ACXAC6_16440 [Candidatus Hodarchaeales archaeon]|jgi:hypothetical protein
MTSGNKDTDVKTDPSLHFEQVDFLSFLQKIGMGMILSFIPAFVYILVSGVNLYTVWGITLLITSGIYFLIGGCSDLRQSSARKSYERYRENIKKTGERADGFKYNVGLTQFGKNWENIAAAICLLTISVLVSGLA